MGFWKALLALMFLSLYSEAPYIKNSTKEKHVQHRESVQIMADNFVKVGSRGELIDPQTDAIILTSISWYEARFRSKPSDGDMGAVLGPMQISKKAPTWAPLLEIDDKEKWEGITTEQLRDPKKNVEFAYDVLRSYKNKCESNDPGDWLDAYGAGKCLPAKGFGMEAKRRCAYAMVLMKRLANDPKAKYTVPEGFVCAGKDFEKIEKK